MHEQSIVESLLALALKKAEEAKASKIVRIYLVVGELSGVVENSVNYYFRFLRQNTIASDATIVFTRTPSRLRCRKCSTVFSPVNMDMHCPKCNEEDAEIIGGRELYMDSLEVA
jgi:hydrogenase nickel incorporation protein HypA/HybF